MDPIPDLISGPQKWNQIKAVTGYQIDYRASRADPERSEHMQTRPVPGCKTDGAPASVVRSHG